MNKLVCLIFVLSLTACCAYRNSKAESSDYNYLLRAEKEKSKCIDTYKERLSFVVGAVDKNMSRVQVIASILKNLPREERSIIQRFSDKFHREGVRQNIKDIEIALIEDFSDLNLCGIENSGLNYYIFIDQMNVGMIGAGLETGRLFSKDGVDTIGSETQAQIAFNLVTFAPNP